jgi:hypothetical protein
VVVPGAGVDLEILESGACFGVIPRGRPERFGVGGRRLFPLSLVAKNVSELEQERACGFPVGGGLQLQLEELLDHVQLSETPVDVARRLEAFGQRRIELVGILKMLESFDARQELPLENSPELQVEAGFLGGRSRRGDALLELLD